MHRAHSQITQSTSLTHSLIHFPQEKAAPADPAPAAFSVSVAGRVPGPWPDGPGKSLRKLRDFRSLYPSRLGKPGQNPGARSAEGFSWPAVPTAHPRLACRLSGICGAHPLVSPAGSVGSRQSATGARSPPPVRLARYNVYPRGTGGGLYSIISFQRGETSAVSPAGSVGRWARPTGAQRSPLTTPFFRAPPPSSLKR